MRCEKMSVPSLFKNSALGPLMLEAFDRACAGFAGVRDSVVNVVKPAAASNRHVDFMLKAAAGAQPFTEEDLDKLLGIYYHDNPEDVWSVRQALFSLYQNFPERALLPVVNYSEGILRSSVDSDQILDAMELLRMLAQNLALCSATRLQAAQIAENVKVIAIARPSADVRRHYNAVFANFTVEPRKAEVVEPTDLQA